MSAVGVIYEAVAGSKIRDGRGGTILEPLVTEFCAAVEANRQVRARPYGRLSGTPNRRRPGYIRSKKGNPRRIGQ